jgi:hypothetical protein
MHSEEIPIYIVQFSLLGGFLRSGLDAFLLRVSSPRICNTICAALRQEASMTFESGERGSEELQSWHSP